MKRKPKPHAKNRAGATATGKGRELTACRTIPLAEQSRTTGAIIPAPPHEPAFREGLALIEGARNRAFQAVNTELIDLYWRVGEYISRKLETATTIDDRQ